MGAPAGHEGATRKTPEPTEVVYHPKPKVCVKCKSRKIQVKEQTKTIEDIEVIKTVKEIHYYECLCGKCGERFETSSKDLPKDGVFGLNILSLWSSMHYIGTIPFDRLARISENCFGIEISPSGLHNAIYRTSEIFEPQFDRIRNRIKNSKYAGSDETKYSEDWLWNFSTDKDVLVLLRNSRGSKVLKEVFGEYYDGILNTDCFSAYDKYQAREYQKDWAHILRDAKDLAKHNLEGLKLYEELLRMYEYITESKENKQENTLKVRLWVWRQKLIMKSWLYQSYQSKAVFNLVKRINKHLDQWFTCLKYDFVEPTNNAREREIRKNVIARKISGCHRSNKGKHAREIMMSNILTAEKRNQNPFEVIRSSIESYNLNPFMS